MDIESLGRIKRLEQRAEYLESALNSSIDTITRLLGIIEEMTARVDQIEQRKKPGPKPKDGRLDD